MFKRKSKKRWHQKLLNWIWPSIGLKRMVEYYKHRVKRIPDTPYRIAAGLASGVAMTFTPLIGLHLIGTAVLCYIVRGNILIGFVGTLIGNPYTFPLIWYLIYRIGVLILGQDAGNVPFETMSFSALANNFWDYFLPMLVGGALLAVPLWFSVFYPVKYVIERHQKERRKIIKAARQKMQDFLQRHRDWKEGRKE